jgi:hypothetical protein
MCAFSYLVPAFGTLSFLFFKIFVDSEILILAPQRNFRKNNNAQDLINKMHALTAPKYH